MDPNDQELLARIKRGDGEGFGVLYDRTRGWLLSFVIIPRVGRTEAEDVLAETYRTALGGIRDFQWRGVGLLHWLAAIAKRKALEHARRGGSRAASLDDLPSLLELPDPSPTAEAEMIRLETLRRLRVRVEAALSKLHPRYAETLRLRLLEGRARPECAELLSVSPATFDVLLHRAAKAFARNWSQE